MSGLIDEDKVILRPLAESDFPTVEAWLNKDYIKIWLGEPEEHIIEIRNENGEFDFMSHFMTMYENIAFGYCHYYDSSKTPPGYEWENEPPGTYGIGYYIGNEDYLKKGFGNVMVQKLCAYIIANENPVQLFGDPMVGNINSIKLLERNGFAYDAATGLYKYAVQ